MHHPGAAGDDQPGEQVVDIGAADETAAGDGQQAAVGKVADQDAQNGSEQLCRQPSEEGKDPRRASVINSTTTAR